MVIMNIALLCICVALALLVKEIDILTRAVARVIIEMEEMDGRSGSSEKEDPGA